MNPLLLIASLQAAEPPALPAATARPLLNYFVCLSTEEQPQEIPTETAAREALVSTILSHCAERRGQAATSTVQALVLDPAFGDAIVRQNAVETWLQHFDRGLRHRIVERERFLEEADAYEACLDRGDTEC